MPDADWLAAYVVKMITVVEVIQEIAREQISVRIDHGNSRQERGIMEIKRVTEDDRVGEFINIEFSDYAVDSNIALNFEEFCFVAEDDGNIVGVITGRAYYNEVHIGDLIVGKSYRKDGVGSKLVAAVEDAYKGKGYEKIALTTFGFQAPEFYKKLGYELEFIRKDTDPRLSKYFYLKKI